jgi:hypothetical protein
LSLRSAQYSHYIEGAGLWLDGLDQLHQLEEFLGPERGTSPRHGIERVLGDHVGPDRRHRVRTTCRVVEKDPVFAPVARTLDQIELLAEQRMVGMGDAKRLSLKVAMRCSCLLAPTPSSNRYFAL